MLDITKFLSKKGARRARHKHPCCFICGGKPGRIIYSKHEPAKKLRLEYICMRAECGALAEYNYWIEVSDNEVECLVLLEQ